MQPSSVSVDWCRAQDVNQKVVPLATLDVLRSDGLSQQTNNFAQTQSGTPLPPLPGPLGNVYTSKRRDAPPVRFSRWVWLRVLTLCFRLAFRQLRSSVSHALRRTGDDFPFAGFPCEAQVGRTADTTRPFHSTACSVAISCVPAPAQRRQSSERVAAAGRTSMADHWPSPD